MQKDVIRQSYIQTEGNHFVRNGEKIILRGWALGGATLITIGKDGEFCITPYRLMDLED